MSVAAVWLLGSAVRAADVPVPIQLSAIVYDYADVPAATLEEAKQVTARLYREIGVEMVWFRAGSPELARLAEERVDWFQRLQPVVLVRLLSPAMVEARHVPQQVLGEAARGAQWAFVLTPRVTDLAERQRLNVALLLGHVIAHEIGHLLLPSGQHSIAGLMRASFDTADLQRHLLRFDRAEARQIRERLTGLRAAGASLEASLR